MDSNFTDDISSNRAIVVPKVSNSTIMNRFLSNAKGASVEKLADDYKVKLAARRKEKAVLAKEKRKLQSLLDDNEATVKSISRSDSSNDSKKRKYLKFEPNEK